jgi:outer membrane protein OmpA-like peptidoglycan-associated protein
MTNTPDDENANQSLDDSAILMTETELLAELLKLLNHSNQVRPKSSLDSIAHPPDQSIKPDQSVKPNQPIDDTAVLEEKLPAESSISWQDYLETPVSSTTNLNLTETTRQTANQILDSLATPASGEDSLVELQKLLFNFDQTQLNQLRERLENPERRAADVGQVLHQAILLQTLESDQRHLFVTAIVPTVEQAIQTSVQKDELVIADAIFPIMGPAIRKAIATALESTMQALDQMLEQSLSPRALQWKLESLRTGKSFAEVVLLRTLLYRVEQVFLIHRHTGLLLQHVMASSIVVQDPELVSSMLQAITDFMQDSFAVQTGDTLETLRFGDLTIWIEQGPQAVLAGVLRGQAPVELRLVFRRAIERIHQELGLSLTAFQGDSAPFAAARPHLESCFQTEYKTPKAKKGHPYFWLFFACIVSVTGFLGYREWQIRHRWAAYLKQLRSEPGIVITVAEKRWNSFLISGLRDPLAVDPTTLLPASDIDPKRVISQWQPYLSLHPKLLAARAQQILHSPTTAVLTVDNQGVLSATGSAPFRWIEDSQKLAPAIPGITQFKNEVAIADLKVLGAIRSRIEAQILQFEQGTTALQTNPQTLNSLTKDLQALIQLSATLRRHVQIQIIGRASPDGSEPQNILLSQSRANTVLEALVAKGVNPARLSAIGIGTKQPLSEPQSGQEINRSVTFDVLFTTAPLLKER